jgi:hypothetical protein
MRGAKMLADLAGRGIGLVLSLARLMSTVLFAVTPTDAPT